MGSKDTTPEAAALQAEIHRRMGGEGRFQLAFEMSLFARELSLTRLRQKYPGKAESAILKAYLQEVVAPNLQFPWVS